MRDDDLRTYSVNCISNRRIYRANARDDQVPPNRQDARARREVARVSFESGEDVEKLPGAYKAASRASDGAFVKWVGNECDGNAAADERSGDSEQRIEIAVGAETCNYYIHLS